MRRKRDSERSEKEGSNGRERKRMGFLRGVYMNNKDLIEARFLASMGGDHLSTKDRLLLTRAFREGAVEILNAVDRTFGFGGVRDVASYLGAHGRSDIEAESPEEDDDGEECDDGGEDGYERTPPADDLPQTYENTDPRDINPWELLRRSRFPFELVDKEEPSGPEPEGMDEEDEDEEIELDIIERVVDWENVRGLWKDFDPAFR